MEVPECPPTPPILTEGLSSPKAGPASPANLKEGSSPTRSVSPEPNCPICLGQLNNKSYSDSCFHKFCFKCLLEWSKVKAECPLCKQKFKSIIHNVKSMEEYDQYTVQQPAAEPQGAERLLMVTMDPWAMSPWFVRRHATVRRHPNLPQTVRRTGNAIIQLFDVIPNTRSSHRMREERHAMRETQRQALQEARNRLQMSGMDLRRSVYRTNLWAQPLSDITGRYREYSLAFFKRNPAMTHRLLPWISRDLSVLCERAHIAVALERVNGLLLRHDLRSALFSQEIREFFGENTRHFLHELISFARSPYDMMGYDREVTHDSWYPGLDDHTITFHGNNNDNNDTSSEDDIMEVPFSPRREGQPPFLRGDVFTRSPSPEPGPSRLFDRIPTPPVPSPRAISSSPLTIGSSTEEEGTRNNNEEISLSDVEVVAVLKPKHERTPEIVDLLSDSDEPVINPGELSHPWDPEQASTSHVSIESSSFINPDEPGPSTSTFAPHVVVENLSNADVKSEDDRFNDMESIIAKQLQKMENPSYVFNLTSDDTSVNYDISTAKKAKHKKSKKKSKRRVYFSSSSDDDFERQSRPRKKICSFYKSSDKATCDEKTKITKSKKSKSHKHRSRSSSSSPKRSKGIKRSHNVASSEESDHSIDKRTKISSKVVWQIRENSSSDDMTEYKQPRIRSIVVKRQPIFDSSQSSSPHPHRHRSDSESSWEPNGKHHKKSKSKDKGKGRGKGKKKPE